MKLHKPHETMGSALVSFEIEVPYPKQLKDLIISERVIGRIERLPYVQFVLGGPFAYPKLPDTYYMLLVWVRMPASRYYMRHSRTIKNKIFQMIERVTEQWKIQNKSELQL